MKDLLIKYDQKKFYTNIFNLKIGDIFYDNQDNYKHHIVLFLLNEPNPQIVYKYYGRHKQWWHYKIESLYFFNQMYNSQLYSKNRF